MFFYLTCYLQAVLSNFWRVQLVQVFSHHTERIDCNSKSIFQYLKMTLNAVLIKTSAVQIPNLGGVFSSLKCHRELRYHN